MNQTTDTSTRKIEPDALYSVELAAPLVLMHPETIREKLRIGTIQGKRKGGGRWRIRGCELLKLA